MPSRNTLSTGFSTGFRVCSLTMTKIEVRGRPAASACDQPVSASATGSSERELKIARERLAQFVDNVPCLLWEAWGKPDAADQHIDFVSPYVEPMLGYSVKEWLATPNFWLTIVHPDDRDKAAKAAADAFSRGAGHINRFRWITKDRRVIDVETRSAVIKDEDGTPIGMRGVTVIT